MKGMQKETHRHAEAFTRYYQMEHRSRRQLAKELGVAYPTIQRWAKAFDWNSRVEELDMHITDGLIEKLKTDGIDMKDYLLKIMMRRLNAFDKDSNIQIRNVTEAIAVIREIRSMIGLSDAEVSRHEGIEYVRTVTNEEAD